MSVNNQNNAGLLVVQLGAVAANTTVKAAKIAHPRHIKALHLYDANGVVQSDVNYLVVSIQQMGMSYGSLSTQMTGGDGAVPVGEWLSKDNIDKVLPAGDLDVVVSVMGTAALAAGSKLTVEYYG
jgi:hypothetical protein